MRAALLVLFSVIMLISCKKSAEQVTGPASEKIAADVGRGPQISWKILEDTSGSKPSHRGFYATYAATGVQAIDSAEKNYAQEFFLKFKKPAEMLQCEDMLVSNSRVTAFYIRQYQGSGANFSSDVHIRYYDSQSGKRLQVKDFFDAKSFLSFFNIAKNYAVKNIESLVLGDDNIPDADKNDHIPANADAGKKLGAALLENTVFDSKNATVIVPAGMIAEKTYGKIYIRIPADSVRGLVKEDMYDFIQSQESSRLLPPQPLHKPVVAREAAIPADSAVQQKKVPENVVALTFDDGPCNYTLRLLDILKEKNVKATFFVVGRMAEHYKPILKRIHEEGHQIANHSWNHADFRKLSLREVRKQLDDTNAQIYEATGQLPSVFRPPYGASNPMVKAASDMPIMLWNIDPLDWKIRNTQYTMTKMSMGGPEDIVLGHDIHVTTVNAIPQVIENLKAKNLKFVTIDELFAGSTLKEGVQYAQRHKPSYFKITVDSKKPAAANIRSVN